jgi:prepilin-type N-terminal cleavage/methylation domain-containing protein
MKPHSPARGFTLLELMVVVAVIAVGAASVAVLVRYRPPTPPGRRQRGAVAARQLANRAGP